MLTWMYDIWLVSGRAKSMRHGIHRFRGAGQRRKRAHPAPSRIRAEIRGSARLQTGPPEGRCVAGFEGLAEGLIGTGGVATRTAPPDPGRAATTRAAGSGKVARTRTTGMADVRFTIFEALSA